MTVSVNFSDVASDADDATESGSGGTISNVVALLRKSGEGIHLVNPA
ncbi:hypothetical protein [Paracoccus marinaquae]|uniref:Uncharacterized protein n=1 Tax=Paracoccus marinaquae TaxID=2841926 RepID=A0ABS6AS43_9RHOB|nr:hypothetical protein [Paracoccus marinaquae]MBU3032425.1 hypothetical protein [Paracoccus marinaquae]